MGPYRPNPLGGWGLRAISLSFVVDDASASPNDATASPPPLFATSPRKPHPHTSSYLWKGVLSPAPGPTQLRAFPQGEDSEEAVSLARRYAREEKLLKAVSEYRRALQWDPTHEPAALEFTSLLYGMGRHKEAYAVSRQLLRDHPELLRVRLNFASLLQKAGKLEEAETETQMVLSELEGKVSEDHPIRAYALHLLGRNRLNSERYGEAEKYFLKVIGWNPDFSEAHLNLAQLYTLMPESKERAVLHFQKVVELLPESAFARLKFGETLLNIGKSRQAIAHLEKAVELAPDSAAAYYRLASAYRNEGDIAKTERILSRFHTLDSKNRFWERSRAKAQAFYKEGTENLKRGDVGHNNQKNVEKALRVFEKAVALSPDYHEAHSGLAQGYLDLSRPREALNHIDQALSLQPYDSHCHYIRALCLQGLRNITAALEALENAINLDPSLAQYHNLLGNLFFSNGQYQETVSAYRKAVDLEPLNALYHLNLSSALAKINRFDESKKEKERYQKLLTKPSE